MGTLASVAVAESASPARQHSAPLGLGFDPEVESSAGRALQNEFLGYSKEPVSDWTIRVPRLRVPVMSSLDEVINDLLDEEFFRQSLVGSLKEAQEGSEKKCEPELLRQLESRIKSTFKTFVERGVVVAFSNSSVQSQQSSTRLNTTITQENLVELDLAAEGVADKRKRYPPLITAYVEKMLQHTSAAAAAIQVEEDNNDDKSLDEQLPRVPPVRSGANLEELLGDGKLVKEAKDFRENANRLQPICLQVEALQKSLLKP